MNQSAAAQDPFYRRAELIEQRQRLLEAENKGLGRTAEVVAAASQETQPEGNVGAENDAVAQDQEPTVQQDPFYQHMQAIGKGFNHKVPCAVKRVGFVDGIRDGSPPLGNHRRF